MHLQVQVHQFLQIFHPYISLLQKFFPQLHSHTEPIQQLFLWQAQSGLQVAYLLSCFSWNQKSTSIIFGYQIYLMFYLSNIKQPTSSFYINLRHPHMNSYIDSNIKFIILTIIQFYIFNKYMAKQGQLKFNYDSYEDDFHRDVEQSGAKKDFNMQTSGLYQKKKDQKKEQKREQKYQPDFQQPNQSQVRSKVQQNNANRQKMIQQNIKLKTQIYELAKQMDEILAKEKKQKKYGIHADQQQDEAVKQKKIQLKKQQIEIMQLKNKIFLTKRQLQYVYDSRGIQGKQDQLKSLQKQLKSLQSQKEGLLRVKKQQTKALKIMRNDGEYEQKVSKLKQQLSKLKQQCKILSQKLLQNERILRKNHQQYITKQSRIKQMEMRIQEGKKKAKKGQSSNIVTVQMIAQVQSQINQLQKDRKQSQKSWQEKIHNIETQLQQRRIQEEKKLLILKQKEKQLKLNQIRIKQLKKLIQHQTTDNNKKSQQPAQSDMKQFRHKRNIKYLKNQP